MAGQVVGRARHGNGRRPGRLGDERRVAEVVAGIAVGSARAGLAGRASDGDNAWRAGDDGLAVWQRRAGRDGGHDQNRGSALMATVCSDWTTVEGGTAALQAAEQRQASGWMRCERMAMRARRGEEDNRGGKSTAADGGSDGGRAARQASGQGGWRAAMGQRAAAGLSRRSHSQLARAEARSRGNGGGATAGWSLTARRRLDERRRRAAVGVPSMSSKCQESETGGIGASSSFRSKGD
ncbi:hypothetical protein NL676_005940 [Syzygium grande]|nr:hypothetical protein NL676_005940 [Syzygium grande]